jgi:hypothetical protein
LSRLKKLSISALAIGLEPMAFNGSVPIVPAMAHAGDQIVLFEELPPLMACEL